MMSGIYVRRLLGLAVATLICSGTPVQATVNSYELGKQALDDDGNPKFISHATTGEKIPDNPRNRMAHEGRMETYDPITYSRKKESVKDTAIKVPESKYWQELKIGAEEKKPNHLKGWIKSLGEGHYGWLQIYGTNCGHCYHSFSTFERVAKKVLSETTNVSFARVNIHVFRDREVAEALQEVFPDSFDYELPDAKGLTEGIRAPNVYRIAEARITKIRRGVFQGDHKTFRHYIKEHSGDYKVEADEKRALKLQQLAEEREAEEERQRIEEARKPKPEISDYEAMQQKANVLLEDAVGIEKEL